MDKEIEAFKNMQYGYKTIFGNLSGYTVFRCGSGLFVKLHKEDEYAVSFFGYYKEKFGASCEIIAITSLWNVFRQEGGYH